MSPSIARALTYSFFLRKTQPQCMEGELTGPRDHIRLVFGPHKGLERIERRRNNHTISRVDLEPESLFNIQYRWNTDFKARVAHGKVNPDGDYIYPGPIDTIERRKRIAANTVSYPGMMGSPLSPDAMGIEKGELNLVYTQVSGVTSNAHCPGPVKSVIVRIQAVAPAEGSPHLGLAWDLIFQQDPDNELAGCSRPNTRFHNAIVEMSLQFPIFKLPYDTASHYLNSQLNTGRLATEPHFFAAPRDIRMPRGKKDPLRLFITPQFTTLSNRDHPEHYFIAPFRQVGSQVHGLLRPNPSCRGLLIHHTDGTDGEEVFHTHSLACIRDRDLGTATLVSVHTPGIPFHEESQMFCSFDQYGLDRKENQVRLPNGTASTAAGNSNYHVRLFLPEETATDALFTAPFKEWMEQTPFREKKKISKGLPWARPLSPALRAFLLPRYARSKLVVENYDLWTMGCEINSFKDNEMGARIQGVVGAPPWPGGRSLLSPEALALEMYTWKKGSAWGFPVQYDPSAPGRTTTHDLVTDRGRTSRVMETFTRLSRDGFLLCDLIYFWKFWGDRYGYGGVKPSHLGPLLPEMDVEGTTNIDKEKQVPVLGGEYPAFHPHLMADPDRLYRYDNRQRVYTGTYLPRYKFSGEPAWCIFPNDQHALWRVRQTQPDPGCVLGALKQGKPDPTGIWETFEAYRNFHIGHALVDSAMSTEFWASYLPPDLAPCPPDMDPGEFKAMKTLFRKEMDRARSKGFTEVGMGKWIHQKIQAILNHATAGMDVEHLSNGEGILLGMSSGLDYMRQYALSAWGERGSATATYLFGRRRAPYPLIRFITSGTAHNIPLLPDDITDEWGDPSPGPAPWATGLPPRVQLLFSPGPEPWDTTASYDARSRTEWETANQDWAIYDTLTGFMKGDPPAMNLNALRRPHNQRYTAWFHILTRIIARYGEDLFLSRCRHSAVTDPAILKEIAHIPGALSEDLLNIPCTVYIDIAPWKNQGIPGWPPHYQPFDGTMEYVHWLHGKRENRISIREFMANGGGHSLRDYSLFVPFSLYDPPQGSPGMAPGHPPNPRPVHSHLPRVYYTEFESGLRMALVFGNPGAPSINWQARRTKGGWDRIAMTHSGPLIHRGVGFQNMAETCLYMVAPDGLDLGPNYLDGPIRLETLDRTRADKTLHTMLTQGHQCWWIHGEEDNAQVVTGSLVQLFDAFTWPKSVPRPNPFLGLSTIDRTLDAQGRWTLWLSQGRRIWELETAPSDTGFSHTAKACMELEAYFSGISWDGPPPDMTRALDTFSRRPRKDGFETWITQGLNLWQIRSQGEKGTGKHMILEEWLEGMDWQDLPRPDSGKPLDCLSREPHGKGEELHMGQGNCIWTLRQGVAAKAEALDRYFNHVPWENTMPLP